MVSLPLARRVGNLLGTRIYAPPRRGHHRSPVDVGLEFTEDTLTTSDGVALHLWVIAAPEPQQVGTAIVGHGIGLTKSASLRQAALLHEAGYGVVMYDHRNHGLSGLDDVRPGMAERFTRDIQAAASFAGKHFRDDRPILAYGFSFSSFPSVYALRDTGTIGAVICDSGPAASIEDLFGGFAAAGALPLPAWLLANPWGRQAMAACVTRATELLDSQWPPPASQGTLSHTPMLFIAGSRDTMVPPAQVQAMAELYARARCVVLEGAHLDTVKQDPDAYRETLLDFLDLLEVRA